MERNRSIATLQLVGGLPCLDLANTVVSRHDRVGPDLLATYQDLLDWSLRTGLLDGGRAARLHGLAARSPASAAATLERVKTLREAIYRRFSATAAMGDPSADLDLLRGQASRAQSGRMLVRTPTGYGWHWPDDDDLDAIAGRLAHAAVELLTSQACTRVKECPGRDCGWLFLDTTRNGQRLWCSDRDCGAIARITRHRSRKNTC